MKKLIILLLVLCLGVPVFAQQMDLGLGFQYGTARIFDSGENLREISEPGFVLTFRMVPETIGFFARAGLLFPSEVTETVWVKRVPGEVEEGYKEFTISNKEYDYVLFLNAALGASLRAPISNQLNFLIDVGLSINNLFYNLSRGGHTIDASWQVRIEQTGQTYKGGNDFRNVTLRDNYSDLAMGLFANPALRFNFTPNIFLELGVAASFDFLRFKSWSFEADFKNATIGPGGSPVQTTHLEESFPHYMVENNNNPMRVEFESTSDFSMFKQFTFIPSLSVGYSF